MAKIMALPKIGVNMTEAFIVKWLVNVGDKVNDGDAIMEAETDKSTQEIYATESGIVAKLLVSEGETVECNRDIMVLLGENEIYTEKSSTIEEKSVVAKIPAASVMTKKGVRISPLAKKIANEKGIDFHMVQPGIPGGRIVKKDVLDFIQRSRSEPCVRVEGGNLEVIPVSPIRKTIGQRMLQSTLEKPCVGLNTTADATAMLKLIDKYKEKGIKISFDAVLAKIAAKTLGLHRNINTILEGDNFLVKCDINVGVAVDTDKGLMVPVIKNADQKSLVEVARELASMAEGAKKLQLPAASMSDGTFTITNLGMFGVDEFAPIINPPECCILGIGALKKMFVPDENDQPKLATMFQMTLVFDHRIVDGAPAARFLRDFKEFVEAPELLI